MKTVKQTEKEKNKKRNYIILLLLLLLILFSYWVGYRIGRIGYIDEETNPVFQEYVKSILVTDETIEIVQNEELNIFKNEKFNNEAIIAPKSKGTYKFYIENIADENVSYDIIFTDEMSNKINMKYRLKLDNVYIRGNENEYVDIEKLSVDDITVLKNSVNIFILEWYWEDDDKNDTYVGSIKNDEYYKLNLKINAKTLE